MKYNVDGLNGLSDKLRIADIAETKLDRVKNSSTKIFQIPDTAGCIVVGQRCHAFPISHQSFDKMATDETISARNKDSLRHCQPELEDSAPSLEQISTRCK